MMHGGRSRQWGVKEGRCCGGGVYDRELVKAGKVVVELWS